MATGTQFPGSVVAKGENQFHETSDLGFSTLAAAISGSPSTFDVNDATNVEAWPTSNFIVRIEKELIFCSSRSGNTITIGTRGYSGTTKVDHSSGVDVRVITASDFIQNQSNEIIAIQDSLKGNTQASLTIDGDLTIDNTNGTGNLNVHGALDLTDSGNIQDAGTDVIQVDGAQNISIPNGTLTIDGTAGLPDAVLLNPPDVTVDGGTNDSPQLVLRAKHDSDTTTGITSASTDYTVQFVSQLSTGSQTGHVEHSVGSNTDQLRLDSGGDVSMANGLLVGGTGSTTSAGNLDVEDTERSVLHLIGDTDESMGTGSNLATLAYRWNDSTVGIIQAKTGDDTTNAHEADITFHTSNGGTLSEVMRLHQEGDVEMGQNGNVGIGTSSPGVKLETAGDISLQVSGSTTGTSLIVSSDDSTQQTIQRSSSTRRHKTNIEYVNADDVNPRDVLNIQPATFNMQGDGTPDAGFIAEDFQGLGLDDGLAYDDEDRVSGFKVDSRVIDAAQHVVLQHHDERISRLEDAIEGGCRCDCDCAS